MLNASAKPVYYKLTPSVKILSAYGNIEWQHEM